MKKHLVIPLLLSSFITFSQTQDKELLHLLDSINAIVPYESLYTKINEQSEEMERKSEEIRQLNESQSELNLFFFSPIFI
jgi:ABC-type uncharacterized transport system substrate-binding protein